MANTAKSVRSLIAPTGLFTHPFSDERMKRSPSRKHISVIMVLLLFLAPRTTGRRRQRALSQNCHQKGVCRKPGSYDDDFEENDSDDGKGLFASSRHDDDDGSEVGN